MKKFANGTYRVEISTITQGVSENSRVPYLLCRFEAWDRYHEERIYLTGNYMKFIKLLYFKANVQSNTYNCNDLIGAELGFKIVSGQFIRNNGQIVSFPKIDKLYSLDEIREMECEREPCFDDNYNVNDTDDRADMADIFGVDIEDVASDMGISISDVDSSTIREYCGY